MRKLSPRAKFIAEATLKSLAAYAWDAMQLASSHDPEHAKEIIRLANLIQGEVTLEDRRFADVCQRLFILERQTERLGAPQYRTLRKGKKQEWTS
jgi:hypothetical protein